MEPPWWYTKIGPGVGLVPSGNKPLEEVDPVLKARRLQHEFVIRIFTGNKLSTTRFSHIQIFIMPHSSMKTIVFHYLTTKGTTTGNRHEETLNDICSDIIRLNQFHFLWHWNLYMFHKHTYNHSFFWQPGDSSLSDWQTSFWHCKCRQM